MDIENTLRKFQRAVFYRRVSGLIIAVGMIISVFLSDLQNLIPMIILVASVILGILLELIFWRCPVCGRFLPGREPSRKIIHCQHCGNRLQP